MRLSQARFHRGAKPADYNLSKLLIHECFARDENGLTVDLYALLELVLLLV